MLHHGNQTWRCESDASLTEKLALLKLLLQQRAELAGLSALVQLLLHLLRPLLVQDVLLFRGLQEQEKGPSEGLELKTTQRHSKIRVSLRVFDCIT